MYYTLFNETTNRYLTHPKVGMWFTTDEKEAEEMLQACRDYLQACGFDFAKVSIIKFDEN